MVQPATKGQYVELLNLRGTDIPELVQARRVSLAHLGHKCNGGKEDSMIAIGEEVLGLGDEVVGEVWYLLDHTKGTECGLYGCI